MSSQQKYALVTGATSGIGYEVAKLLAKDQFNLVLVARSEQELRQTAAELKHHGVQVLTIAKDLSLKEAPFQVYEEVKSQGIHIDVLVNNAAQGQYGEFVDTDIQRELEIIQLNICAYLVLTKCFLREMMPRNEGRILIVSSIGGEIPGPLQAVYHATKAFLNSFTVAVREEIRNSNITITTLMPGPTDTDFFNKAEMEDARLVQHGKLDDPAKVAKEGYEALMAGENEIITGLQNKAMVATSKVVTDRVAAKGIRKMSEPTHKNKDKT